MNKDKTQYHLIILNGDLPSERLLRETAEVAETIIAADGAANKLREHGIAPKYIVGDRDSVTQETVDAFPQVKLAVVPEQVSTDCDKTIRFALESGAQDIVILGAGGGRLDHTLNNLGVVKKYHKDAKIALLDDHCRTVIVSDKLAIPTRKGQKISILPIGPTANVTTHGLRWELKNETLELGVRDSLSNEATGDQVAITVGAGHVAVFIFH